MGNIEHGTLGYAEQHVAHFKEYANSTAREAASGLATGDDHKVALQTDDHSYWVLTDYTGPTWVQVSGLASGTKVWFYQNTAPVGWTLDGTPSDDLLAVKGGSDAYNANGGTGAGTWTVAGLTKDAHTHSFTQPNGHSNHAFTQPTAHGITQPTFVANIFINAVKTQIEYKQTAATQWTATNEADVPSTDTSSETTSYGADCERTTNVALTNNHSGGGVDAHSAHAGGAVGAQDDAVISSDATWRPKARLGIICSKD